MRFTSIDPAASPVYNLYAYSNNSPARFFDPDGLEPEGWTIQNWAGKWVRDGYAWADEKIGADGWLAAAGNIPGGLADAGWFVLSLPAQPVIWAASGEAPMPVQNWVGTANNAIDRWERLSQADVGTGQKTAGVGLGVATDLFGVTGFGEAWNNYNFTTGDVLTPEESKVRWVTGTFTMLTYAAPVAGKGFSWARGRVGTGNASASPRQHAMSEFRRFKGQGFTNKQAYHLAQPLRRHGSSLCAS